jgi:S1-C subfamily serine protease
MDREEFDAAEERVSATEPESPPDAAADTPSDPQPAWSATPAPPPPEYSWPSQPPAREKAPRANSGMRNMLVAALIGALIGGGVAGGIVAAVDDDGGGTTIVQSGGNVPARASTAIAKPGDLGAIIEKVKPAVVRIDSGSGAQQGTGTGFIIASDGVIVTNAHVVEGSDTVQVTFEDGDDVEGKVLGSSPTVDLAVVKVNRSDLPTVKLGDSDSVQVGDAVVAIGNALGLSDGSGLTVTTGIVSGLDRTVDVGVGETLLNAIQTDAAINPGNSGGPLLDSAGRVIGINTAIANPGSSNNVGFAIAISSARPIFEDLRQGKEPRIAFLGVRTQTVTPSLAEQENLKTDKGAYVVEVTPGSGAANGGIKQGDVIVEIDGQSVERDDQVLRAVRGHHPGDKATVVVMRGDKRQTLSVTLGDFSRQS